MAFMAGEERLDSSHPCPKIFAPAATAFASWLMALSRFAYLATQKSL
jgi:hypothetical protein